MNRNGTAILATAILFSMLASSGVRSSSSPRSGASAVSLQQPTSSSTKPANTNNDFDVLIGTAIEAER